MHNIGAVRFLMRDTNIIFNCNLRQTIPVTSVPVVSEIAKLTLCFWFSTFAAASGQWDARSVGSPIDRVSGLFVACLFGLLV